MICWLLGTYAAHVVRARERLAQFRQNVMRLIEASNDGMWAVDLEGDTFEANTRLAEILGVSKTELVRNKIDDYFVPTLLDPSGSTDAAPGGSEEGARVVRFKRRGGEMGWGII